MSRTESLLRYPGGKTKLYPFVSNLLDVNNINGTYIEPFAGGAGIALKLLFENKVDNIWINDYDKSIYSIWYATLNYPDKLITLINDVPFDVNGSKNSDEENIEYWKLIKRIHKKESNYQNSIMNAFSTLMLNRMNISGIINGGPIGGMSQTNNKLYVRFNKNTLINKIIKIHQHKNNIKLTRMNALKMIPTINQKNSFVFFDPPYFHQGKNLYMSFFSKKDHYSLSKIITLTSDDLNWIVTYDNSSEIKCFYGALKNKFYYNLNYSANNKNRGNATELLFANHKLKIRSFDKTQLIKINDKN